MSDLVSIIVPTYNRAYCVAKTIDSALAQTHHNLEVLVVDDGSTDDTATLLRQRYGSEPRVKCTHQTNAGVSAARNAGLWLAQGNFIALLDSDDLWKPCKLQVQLRCLQAAPEVGMIWTDMEALDPAGNVVHPRYLHEMYHAYRWFTTGQLFPVQRPLRAFMADAPAECRDATLFVGDLFSPMVMGNLVHTSTVVLTRARFEQVGFFDVDLRLAGEDYDFHLRTCRAGPVAFLDVASIQYQLAFSDRLSQHLGAVARNFVDTVERTVARERDHIHLPPAMIQTVLAGSHSWLGEELLASGHKAEAARSFRRSLHYKKMQPRVMLQWLRCQVPELCERAGLALYRLLKRDAPAPRDYRKEACSHDLPAAPRA